MKNILTLSNRVALVTGASQGIGYSIAKMLCDNGVKTAIVDINEEKAFEVAQEFNNNGCDALGVGCDVSNVESIGKMVQAVVQKYGGIDVVVNCAGILGSSTISEMQRREWDKVLAVNLTGPFFVIQKTLPYLEKSSCARIINISSLAGRMGGFETSMSYTATKGGIISLTYGIARQLAPKGITVNAVCPGTTETPIIKGFTEDAVASLKTRIPIGRLGKPEDVATAVCYLASEEAGFVTGLLLDVNGGMYMG
jgi:3-oxoacyl-[acyl-carrier protein] reductase